MSAATDLLDALNTAAPIAARSRSHSTPAGTVVHQNLKDMVAAIEFAESRVDRESNGIYTVCEVAPPT